MKNPAKKKNGRTTLRHAMLFVCMILLAFFTALNTRMAGLASINFADYLQYDLQVTEEQVLLRRQQQRNVFLEGLEDAISIKDTFAASWWQRTDRFLLLDCEKYIKSVEDDAFAPILHAGRGYDDVRIPRDLLDLSVEHLSKWWKDVGGDAPYHVRHVLANYTSRIRAQPQQDDYMNETLAVIPYGVADGARNEMKLLWGDALAATMASILKHGVARILVVGHYKADEILARKVFGMLSGNETFSNEDSPFFETTVGATEVAFVHTDNITSAHARKNIPKGALVDLSDALAGRIVNPSPYLGASTAERFKYVFLTESDQILNARITPTFMAAMDDGRVLVPHRIQPMPHPDDVAGFRFSKKLKSMPSHKFVIALDGATGDSCCDTGTHQRNYHKGSYCIRRTCMLLSAHAHHPFLIASTIFTFYSLRNPLVSMRLRTVQFDF